MDYESILVQIGQFGRWQKIVFGFVCICSMVEAFNTFSFTFIGFTPEFRCKVDLCDGDSPTFRNDFVEFAVPKIDGKPSQCERFSSTNDTCDFRAFTQDVELCQRHVYDESVYKNSYVAEFDLAPSCKDPHWVFGDIVTKPTFISMAYMAGMLNGSFVCGILADIFGRKKMLIASIVGASGFSFIGAFVTNFWGYAILRHLTGIFAKGLFLVAFIICVEVSGAEYGAILGILIQVPFALGEVVVAVLALLIQQWKALQITLAVLVFATLTTCLVIPESPRWLIALERFEDAKKILEKGARMNKRKLPENIDLAKLKDNKESKNYNIISLFGEKFVASITIIMIINWMVTTLCYYGLSLNSVNLVGTDPYLNFALTGFIEIPSYLFVAGLIDRIGRKPLLIFCQLLAGAGCLAAGLIGVNQRAAITAMTLIGKFGASASFSLVYVYTAELYPTEVRSTAIGLPSTFSRVTSIIAPFVASLHGSKTYIIMGVPAIVGALLAAILPETLGSELPASLEQVKRLRKKAKPWWKWVSKTDLQLMRKDMKDVAGSLELGKSTNGASVAPKFVIVEENNPSHKFSIPHINVINPTPSGSLRAVAVKKPRQPIHERQEDQQKENHADKSTIEPEETPKDKPSPGPSILELVSQSVMQVDTGSRIFDYPEYEPLRRLSQDLRDAKKKEEEALKAFDEIDAGSVETYEDSVDNEPPKVEASAEKPIAGLTVLAADASRKFSQLAPAPTDSPNAQKVGTFSIIPTEKKKSLPDIEVPDQADIQKASDKPVAGVAVLPDEASRKFSQLAPAPTDSPQAKKIGAFSVIPTENKTGEPGDDAIPTVEEKPVASLAALSDHASRKFSQLAPAPTDSPHAKKVGFFSIIPTEKKPSNDD